MEQSESYRAAIEKGRQLYSSLNSFHSTPQSGHRLGELYEVDIGMVRPNPVKKLRDELESFGKTIGNPHFVEVKSHGVKSEDAAPYMIHVDPYHGVVVCWEIYKDRDKNPVERRLWPSEVIWQSFTTIASMEVPSIPSSSIQMVVQHHVENQPTREVIWESAKHSSKTRSGPHHQEEYTRKDEGFYAILGSVLGSCTARMLIDHKLDTGRRSISRIVVLGKKGVTLDHPVPRTFAVILSAPVNVKTLKQLLAPLAPREHLGPSRIPTLVRQEIPERPEPASVRRRAPVRKEKPRWRLGPY